MAASDIIINEVLKIENRSFWFRILASAIGYFLITIWLNSIRATAALWIVWPMIIIQFTLYFAIFFTSYRRSQILGLNKNVALIIFVVLAILGRVENWEIIITPLLVVTMLVLSGINKKISTEAQERFLKNE